LGLWRSATATQVEAVAFDTAKVPQDAVWRVRLPANTGMARILLTEAESSLLRSQLALPEVDGRLRALLAARAGTPFAGAPVPTVRGRAELELDRLLAELGPPAGEVDFASGRLSTLWEEVVDQATAFLVRLNTATTPRGRVETEQDGRVVARTELSWQGGTRTIWQAGSAGDDWSDLHRRAVALVFESRLALVRIFATVLQAAALLAALATPGGAVLATPAALRFVAQVLADARAQSWRPGCRSSAPPQAAPIAMLPQRQRQQLLELFLWRGPRGVLIP
jgi:hypothetical protein